MKTKTDGEGGERERVRESDSEGEKQGVRGNRKNEKTGGGKTLRRNGATKKRRYQESGRLEGNNRGSVLLFSTSRNKLEKASGWRDGREQIPRFVFLVRAFPFWVEGRKERRANKVTRLERWLGGVTRGEKPFLKSRGNFLTWSRWQKGEKKNRAGPCAPVSTFSTVSTLTYSSTSTCACEIERASVLKAPRSMRHSSIGKGQGGHCEASPQKPSTYFYVNRWL